jgi:hypothetical protein
MKTVTKELSTYIISAFIAAASVFGAEPGKDARAAISADGGTLGLGGSLWLTINESFTFAVGYNGFSYDQDVSTSDVNFDGQLRLSNVPVLLNWHPFKGTFRLAAGVVFSDNKVEVTGRPNANTTFTINGVNYTAAQVGSLTGTGKYENSTAPYAGLGWSKSPKGKGFGVFADLGVMFAGSPKVSLKASGPISSDPTFQANLARENKKANDEIAFANVYPVIRLGFMYRF